MAQERKKKPAFPFVLAGILLGIILKIFVIDIMRVSGDSMSPTISEGSTVIVNKLAYGIVKPGNRDFFVQWSAPSRGDIVIFLHDDKIVMKRCVGIGGDVLEYFADNGYNLIVGENKISLTELQYAQMRQSKSVADGYILAIGDNYDKSIDSRNYGFVSVKNIVGKVVGK